MLQTCNRCRTRRIKCDALLPACANCAKVNFQCSFRDDVLQENIPRSYIKGLYDRINELNSLLSVQKFQTDGGLQHAHQISNPSNQTPAHHILASKSGQYLYLGPSPPAIIGCSAISRLLSLDFAITPPPILVGAEGTEEVCDISKLDRSIISPSAIRLLLAHYDRCIRPLYPIKLSNFATETETSLKHLTELERFKVLIACAIAASHKSYHVPSWKTIAKVARDWAGELAVSIVAMRDDEAVVALLLLLVYELTDSEKAIIWELLGFAIRFCLELGWHRLEQDTMALPTENADPQDQPSQLSDADKRQLMSVLHSIERPLRVIFQRPSMLSGCKNLSGTQEDLIFETYMQISTHLFGFEAPVETNHCPMSPATFHLIASLDQLPFQNQLVLESWILFFPICVDHIPCDLCSSTLNRPGPADLSTIRTTILRAAIQLLSLIHAVVSSGDVFIPPLMASSKAFTAGCVLVVGMTSGWAGTENYIGPLLKCSEVMAFCAPLWKGGKEYHEVWRKVAGVI